MVLESDSGFANSTPRRLTQNDLSLSAGCFFIWHESLGVYSVYETDIKRKKRRKKSIRIEKKQRAWKFRKSIHVFINRIEKFRNSHRNPFLRRTLTPTPSPHLHLFSLPLLRVIWAFGSAVLFLGPLLLPVSFVTLPTGSIPFAPAAAASAQPLPVGWREYRAGGGVVLLGSRYHWCISCRKFGFLSPLFGSVAVLFAAVAVGVAGGAKGSHSWKTRPGSLVDV